MRTETGSGLGLVAQPVELKIATLPLGLRKSITWGNGSKMAQHARFKPETDLPIYFCDPRSSWQRGTNKNTSGLWASTGPKAPTCVS